MRLPSRHVQSVRATTVQPHVVAPSKHESGARTRPSGGVPQALTRGDVVRRAWSVQVPQGSECVCSHCAAAPSTSGSSCSSAPDIRNHWARLLFLESDEQSSVAKAAIGASFYGLGETLAQVLQHGPEIGEKFDVPAVVFFAALGASLEGVLNPWWRAEIARKLHDSVRHPGHIKPLQFFLDNLIWTPLCCEAVFALQYLVVDGHWTSEADALANLLRALVSQSEAVTGPTEEALEEVYQMSSELMDEISASSKYNTVASTLLRFTPGPIRPFLRRVSDASSWTLLDV